MKLLSEYWFIIDAVLIPVASYLIGRYRSKNKIVNDKINDLELSTLLLKDGMCALQKNSLYKSCEDYRHRGYCSFEAKKTLNELYKSYHDLGGDSFITQMVEQINLLPDKECK